MIELTPEQRRDVAKRGQTMPRAIDPDTQTTYVLVPADVYERARALFVQAEEDRFLQELYPHVMEVFAREGWDDPVMDVYNELDPRRKP